MAEEQHSFLYHFREMRSRLKVSLSFAIIAFLISFILYPLYINSLIEPLGKTSNLTYHELLHPFLLRIKISAYISLIFGSPVHVVNITGFIIPALTKRERKILVSALVAAGILAVFGGYMAFNYMIEWLIEFNSAEIIAGSLETYNIEKAIMLMFKIILGFMFLFMLPVLLDVLMALDLVSRKTLLSNARYAIVSIFIIAAIVTPPDPWSQLLLAGPLIIFFYTSILVAKIFGWGDS